MSRNRRLSAVTSDSVRARLGPAVRGQPDAKVTHILQAGVSATF